MPFWWRRRRKPWFGRWRKTRFRRYKRRNPRRRRFTRRRARKTNRRRRKHRYKVRRKKRKIPVMQWQPESIRKCKIKGMGLLVLGAEGTQMYCYTTDKDNYIPPKVPYGGSFGVELYTLRYLYEEYTFHNNIWTASNLLKDLCRYLYCKLIFYRHDHTDFVVTYDIQPPFDINKYTFPGCHPQQLLLTKHKKIIYSTKTKPNGKYTVKFNIKPPKQMITKWFFTKPFSDFGLLLLKGAALNLRNSYLTPTNENLLVNLISLNTSFYRIPDWSQSKISTGAYLPYSGVSKGITFQVPKKGGTTDTYTPDEKIFSDYSTSVSWDKGWFNPKILQSTQVNNYGTFTATHTTIAGRYNPTIDNGKGNKVYLVSTLQNSWAPPRTDKTLYFEDMPLWLCLYGYYSFIKTINPKTYNDIIRTHVLVIESPAIHCYPEIGSCSQYVPIDIEYTKGEKPYNRPVWASDKTLWVPNMNWQMKTINSIVESGPYMQKLSEERESTWELKYTYQFYFKWGGPHTPGKEVKNPQDLDTYPVPDTMPKTIQITNPEKLSTETIFHPWDTRRGQIKESALKRMLCHLETDSEFEFPTEELPKKKKRLGAALQAPQEETQEIQACLQDLCKENIYQETQTDNLQQLINQQQQQQQHLKYNILKLLIDLKNKQKMIQLQTGMLE
nr:MAG: ORF1 [Torque teno midi virus]